ncbi:MAG: DUF6112 family protein [Actinomycetota bacterium]|jgi:hypothetical protein
MLRADVHMTPTPTALPGSAALQQLVNGLAGWALLLCLAAMIIGAVLWAFGSHSQNMHQSMAGRRSLVTAVLAAIVIGSAPSLVNFFFHTGLAVH